jgi:hypothetical protein
MHSLGEAFTKRSAILVPGRFKGKAQDEWGTFTVDDAKSIASRTAPTQRAHSG